MRWWQRLRRWFRPPRGLTITRLGRVYLALTLGVGIAALNTGNNLLYLVLGFLLSIVVLSGVLSERVLRGLSVRRLLPDGAFAGEPFAMRYELSVRAGRGFALKVTEQDNLLVGHAWFPLVLEGTPEISRADVTAAKRGPLKLVGVEVATTFPLGLFEKSIPLDVKDTLIVYPRRGFVCESPPADDQSQAGDSGNPRHRDGTGDLLGLKELEPHEDARRIHWKKSASAGRLLKTEREREDRKQYTLAVDSALTGAALERACEETAAMSRLLIGTGHEVGLLASGRKLRPGSGPAHERRVLTALAWVGFADAPATDEGGR